MSKSKLIMMFDTETTGRTDFKAPFNAAHQPNLIQLGYKVKDAVTRETVFEIGELVNSTEFKEWNGIEEGAKAVHGISEEMVKEYGNAPEASLSLFVRWANRCGLFVAHNKQFDMNIMQCFALRCGWSPDIFSHGQTFCTMMSTTNIVKAPNLNRGGFKWPKLDEAYMHFTGQTFSGAHNALVDVNACDEIFWQVIDRGHFKLSELGL